MLQLKDKDAPKLFCLLSRVHWANPTVHTPGQWKNKVMRTKQESHTSYFA